MISTARNIQAFFNSQNFTDGLKVTFAVLLPSVVLAQLGELEIGFLASLGALTVSIPDFPGPRAHRRNGMLLCAATVFVMALLTGFLKQNVWMLGAEVVLVTFFFSMFAVYGNRGGALGTAAILVMVVIVGQHLEPEQVPEVSLIILAGGVWYLLLSLLLSRIRPYRHAQQALGECIREIAAFVQLKSRFYDPKTNLDEAYQKLLAQQILVNEKQEAVREILFKSRQLVKDSNPVSRRLLLTFVDVVDLYEQVMAIQYNYTDLKKKYSKSPLLPLYARCIGHLADELDNIGFAIQSNTSHKLIMNLPAELEELKQKTEATGAGNEELKKVLANIERLMQNLLDIAAYFNPQHVSKQNAPSATEFSRFVSHQEINWSTFRINLSPNSIIFKHAVRVSVACFFGFVLTKMLNYGEYSHWVILTIIVILKPAFSLTKQRNIQRLLGTLAGGIIGVIILIFIADPRIQFMFLVLFMLLTFTFIRINYILAVIFMTPFILILFNFMGADNYGVISERVLDTLLGSGIAFAASYLIFPNWEREQIQNSMRAAIAADLHYLEKLVQKLEGKEVLAADYKLARKEVYVSSANLSAAFQRMLSEPKSKQHKSSQIHRFVVLNHVLSANIATIASVVLSNKEVHFPDESLDLVKEIQEILNQALQQFSGKNKQIKALQPAAGLLKEEPVMVSEKQVLEQLQFIRKVSYDLLATVSDL